MPLPESLKDCERPRPRRSRFQNSFGMVALHGTSRYDVREEGAGRKMKVGVFWMLTVGTALFSVDVVSAGQVAVSRTQSAKARAQARGAPSVKVTVMKSVGVPVANKETTPTPPADKPGNRTTDLQPAVKPSANSHATPKTASKASTKSRTSSPIPRKPAVAPPPPAEHESGAASQAQVKAPAGEITIEGAIAALDLQATPPTLQLTLPHGPTWTLTVDPPATSIVNRGQSGTLADLQVRDQVKVLYTSKDGQRLVKSIKINGMPASTAGPSTEASAVGVLKPSS